MSNNRELKGGKEWRSDDYVGWIVTKNSESSTKILSFSFSFPPSTTIPVWLNNSLSDSCFFFFFERTCLTSRPLVLHRFIFLVLGEAHTPLSTNSFFLKSRWLNPVPYVTGKAQDKLQWHENLRNSMMFDAQLSVRIIFPFGVEHTGGISAQNTN